MNLRFGRTWGPVKVSGTLGFRVPTGRVQHLSRANMFVDAIFTTAASVIAQLTAMVALSRCHSPQGCTAEHMFYNLTAVSFDLLYGHVQKSAAWFSCSARFHRRRGCSSTEF